MDWNAMAQPWVAHEDGIERAHLPVREGLLARAALRPGERVLDIGCGSGATTVEAARQVGPDGAVIAFDIAEAFVARVAGRTADMPQVTALRGDAQTHDFGAVRCDVVMSLFGTMFFAEPAAALANIVGALAPGGRIVFATWAGPEHNPWFAVPGRALAGAVPGLPPPDPLAPGPMAFADTDRVTGLMRAAGLAEAAGEPVDTVLTPDGAAADVTAMMFAVGPGRRVIAEFAEPGREAAMIEAVTAQMIEGFGAFAGAEGVRVPARVIYYTGVRPAA